MKMKESDMLDKTRFPTDYSVRIEYKNGTVLYREHLNAFQADEEYHNPSLGDHTEEDIFSITVFESGKPAYGCVAHDV